MKLLSASSSRTFRVKCADGGPDTTIDGVDQDCDGIDGPDADGDRVVAVSTGVPL